MSIDLSVQKTLENLRASIALTDWDKLDRSRINLLKKQESKNNKTTDEYVGLCTIDKFKEGDLLDFVFLCKHLDKILDHYEMNEQDKANLKICVNGAIQKFNFHLPNVLKEDK